MGSYNTAQFDPFGSWKVLKMRRHNLAGQSAPLPGHPHREKNLFLFSARLSYPPTTHGWESQFHLSEDLVIGAAVRSPRPPPLHTEHCPSLSLSSGAFQPWSPQSPPQNLFWISHVCSVLIYLNRLVKLVEI